MMANHYSAQWFDTFLAPIPVEQTAREMDFLARNLLPPHYLSILDVCCGMGRHARELSARGYRVTGVDVNEYALEHARAVDSHTRYVWGDMRELGALGVTSPQPSPYKREGAMFDAILVNLTAEPSHSSPYKREGAIFDAVLILWQSFGYFDEATNEKIVRDIARILNPRGRFILDIYNRGFFEMRLGERKIEMDARVIIETKTLNRNRLRVELDYGAARDEYEWQIFYADEIAALAARCGFREILRCANFDETIAVSSEIPRMQFVFEKR